MMYIARGNKMQENMIITVVFCNFVQSMSMDKYQGGHGTCKKGIWMLTFPDRRHREFS